MRLREDFVLDIERNPREEQFILRLRESAADSVEFFAVDIRPKRRHLLLVAKLRMPLGEPEKRKFLCGHDERHWFVAPLSNADHLSDIDQAMESLKPAAAIASQRRNRVGGKRINARRNAGFIRQGEWFFIPRPELSIARAEMILRAEPIRRAGGAPHIVEELYREGGEQVYVCARYPHGVSEARFRELTSAKPDARKWDWRPMRRNPRAYARGRVRHPDHATICLSFWHEVHMSDELRAANVAFLD